MPDLDADEQRVLDEHISSREVGRALPGPLYRDELIYRAEISRIWRRGWLFAGFGCEIPKPGDYFTFELDGDSLILIRDEDGRVRALYNVCRHRGTTLMDDSSGCVASIVCPYHQWTYARDGSLLGFRGMQDGIDKSQLGLHPAHLEEVDGLIFVSLADNPPDFLPAYQLMAPAVRPQGFARAKVAKVLEYEIQANWKLVWDNNRECFHCNVNHPQYIKANFDHYNADDTSDRIRASIDAAVARSEQKWSASGLEVTHKDTGIARFPDSERGIWFSANRTTLVDGFVTESMDGKQVAPLMGDYVDPDVGTLRLRTLPNFWCHASCDHAVSARLLPAGRGLTKARSTWLVHEDAVEGKDYQLEELLPFWQLTNEQDWDLCARAQRGIRSSRYTPGPLSIHKEYNVAGFHDWVLSELGKNESDYSLTRSPRGS